MRRLSRLTLVAVLTAALTGPIESFAADSNGVFPDRIVLGQTAGFTGTVAGSVKETADGAKAYFEQVNKAGGVNGRRIELVSLDDKFDPKLAGANCKTLAEERKVFALFLTRGTPHTEACLAVVEADRIPLVAPSTGAEIFHHPIHPLVFNVRAKYQDEVVDAVRYFSTVGVTKIALVHVDDSFGKDALTGFVKGMELAKLTPAGIVSFDRTKMDMEAAADQALKGDPAAIIVAASGAAVPKLVDAVRKRGSAVQMMTMSNNSSAAFVKSLGANAHGVIVSQVTPSPYSGTTQLARDFQTAIKAVNLEPSYAAMEGYMAAKVMVEGLRRAGGAPTRESFVQSLEAMRNWDMGGISIGYGPNDRTGATFTELSIISRDGRFQR